MATPRGRGGGGASVKEGKGGNMWLCVTLDSYGRR